MGTGEWGDFAFVVESTVEIAFASGVERQPAVLFADEPPGWKGATPTGCVDYTRYAASWWMRTDGSAWVWG